MCADFNATRSVVHFFKSFLLHTSDNRRALSAERCVEVLVCSLRLNNCHELATAVCFLFCPGLFIHRCSH